MINKIVISVGSAVFASVMYCIPILLTLSYCLEWDGFIKMLLLICATTQFALIWIFVTEKASEV